MKNFWRNRKKRKFYSSFFCSTNFPFDVFTFLLVIFCQFCREICISNFPYYLQEFYRIIFIIFLNSTNIFANRQNKKIGKNSTKKHNFIWHLQKGEKNINRKKKQFFIHNFFNKNFFTNYKRNKIVLFKSTGTI